MNKNGKELLGRVVDGLGNPIDGKGKIKISKTKSKNVKISQKMKKSKKT